MFSKELNISKQLLKSVLLIYFFITIVVTVVHFIVEYNYTKSHIQDELKIISLIFKPPLQTAIWELDDSQLNSISDGIINMPLVYKINIVDPNGKKIISRLKGSLKDDIGSEDESLSYSFDLNKQVNGNTIYLAKVTLLSENQAIFDRIKAGITMLLLNAIIKSIALIMLFIIAFKKYLENPLQELTQKISSLNWKYKDQRNIDIQFEWKNELSVLQKKFNELLSNISKEEEKRFQLLLTMNAKLEYEVKNRTKELEIANKSLEKLANTDTLTKLSNRSRINDELLYQYNDFIKSNNFFSIIMLDIDYFKSVNDTYGHQVGDSVLSEIATILQQNTKGADVVGRWGDEEFLIICNKTNIEGAYKLANNIRTKIESYDFSIIGHKTVSLGVAQIEEGIDIKMLVNNVDLALYRAKESGRNKVVKFQLN